MYFIQINEHAWLLNDTVEITEYSLPLMFDTQKEPWCYGGPNWSIVEHEVWNKAANTTPPRHIETNEEIKALYEKYEKAWEERNQFEQEMCDLEWEMEQAIHGSWYGPNSSLSKK